MAHKILLAFTFCVAAALNPLSAANAQGTSIALTAGNYDNSLPVEVTADALNVAQASNSAEFVGNAKAIQGDMRLAADKVVVKYNQEQSSIEQVIATGNVVFTNGTEGCRSKQSSLPDQRQRGGSDRQCIVAARAKCHFRG